MGPVGRPAAMIRESENGYGHRVAAEKEEENNLDFWVGQLQASIRCFWDSTAGSPSIYMDYRSIRS